MYGINHNMMTADQGVVVRLAESADCVALLRLAALDSASVPGGSLAVAEVGGELVAAVPVNGGRAIADPFRPTASLVEMLEVWALQLRDRPRASTPSLAERARGLARTARLGH